MDIEQFKHYYFRLPVLIRLLLTVFLAMFFFGAIIHFIEPKQFPTIFDGIWWAFVTGATVGYGDYVPLTNTGRMMGILLILTGGGIITFYISVFAAGTVKHERNLSKGRVAYKGSNHAIFIGWNERTRQLIDHTLKYKAVKEIVLIDQTLEYLSYQRYPIHFIHGDATDDFILKQANIEKAAHVLITADTSKKEREADSFTILATVAIRGNNKDVPIVAEILSQNQIENALRAGASTIIRPNDFMGILLYHECFRKKAARPFESLLHLLSQQQFERIPIPENLANKTFLAALSTLKQKNYLAIGIIRDGNWKLNPPADFIIVKNDILIAISPWEKA